MSTNFFEKLENEIGFRTETPNPQTPSVQSAPEGSRRPSGKGYRKGRRGGPKHDSSKKPLPKRVSVARKSASEAGVLVIIFLSDASARAILTAPRIESRGFFFPHEIREGHRFLLSESRRSYEETLKDVPDIETKDLEKIVKKDLEKAVSEKFSRQPLIITVIQTL